TKGSAHLTIALNGYEDLTVVIDNPEPTEGDVDAEVERIRLGWAPLEETGQPAKLGDVIEVQLQASRGGEEYPEMSSPAFACELGSAAVSDEFDHALIGSAVGDDRGFECSIGGKEIHFDATVLRVRHQNVPELTDEWVRQISQAESIEAWRQHVKAELRSRR